MLTAIILAVIWAAVTIGFFVREDIYYTKHPEQWSRRFEGMISLSDSQRFWCYIVWPLVIVALVIYLLFLLVCAAIEQLQEYRNKVK